MIEIPAPTNISPAPIATMFGGINFIAPAIISNADANPIIPCTISPRPMEPKSLTADATTFRAAPTRIRPTPMDTILPSAGNLFMANTNKPRVTATPPMPLAMVAISISPNFLIAEAIIFRAVAINIIPAALVNTLAPEGIAATAPTRMPIPTPTPTRPLTSSPQLSSERLLTATDRIRTAPAIRIIDPARL